MYDLCYSFISWIIFTAFSLFWNRRVQFDPFCGHVLLECLFWFLFSFIITLNRSRPFFSYCSFFGEINPGLLDSFQMHTSPYLLFHLVFTNMPTHSLRFFGSVLPPPDFIWNSFFFCLNCLNPAQLDSVLSSFSSEWVPVHRN